MAKKNKKPPATKQPIAKKIRKRKPKVVPKQPISGFLNMDLCLETTGKTPLAAWEKLLKDFPKGGPSQKPEDIQATCDLLNENLLDDSSVNKFSQMVKVEPSPSDFLTTRPSSSDPPVRIDLRKYQNDEFPDILLYLKKQSNEFVQLSKEVFGDTRPGTNQEGENNRGEENTRGEENKVKVSEENKVKVSSPIESAAPTVIVHLKPGPCAGVQYLSQRIPKRVLGIVNELLTGHRRLPTEHQGMIGRQEEEEIVERLSYLPPFESGQERWLSAGAINRYLAIIRKSLPASSGVVIAITEVWQNYDYGGEDCLKNNKNVAPRELGKMNIFKSKRAIFPMNVGGMHWVCGVYDLAANTVIVYDSLSPKGVSQRYGRALCDMIKEWHRICEGTNEHLELRPLAHASSQESIPVQENGYDCGVFACLAAEFAAQSWQVLYTMDCIKRHRVRMLYTLYTRKTIYEFDAISLA